jgi:hypothetical protein
LFNAAFTVNFQVKQYGTGILPIKLSVSIIHQFIVKAQIEISSMFFKKISVQIPTLTILVTINGNYSNDLLCIVVYLC